MSQALINTDIHAYLQQHHDKDMLRLLTCGSVDDGKSTLIGRLLFDSQQVLDDQLHALEQDNARLGNAGDALDLALLVDGLASEREQGITIDVAYRYFTTEVRKFIIADTPGHEQYTRNMATGASKCELAIVMVDASKGIAVQTRRHSFICSLLGIKQIVVAINKMDMVGFSEAVFDKISADYQSFAEALGFEHIEFLPISALNGDNVVHASNNMPWYRGLPLLEYLQQVPLAHRELQALRLNVQYVNRANSEFRGYAGTISAGELHVGQEILCLPAAYSTTVTRIIENCQEVERAIAGQAVTITVADELDIARGDLLVSKTAAPVVSDQFSADLVWFANTPLLLGRDYYIKFASKIINGKVSRLNYAIDVNSFAKAPSATLHLNEIGSVAIELAEKVPLDLYQEFARTGAFIIIDRFDNATVAAGMVREVGLPISQKPALHYSDFDRELNALIRRKYPEWNCKEI